MGFNHPSYFKRIDESSCRSPCCFEQVMKCRLFDFSNIIAIKKIHFVFTFPDLLSFKKSLFYLQRNFLDSSLDVFINGFSNRRILKQYSTYVILIIDLAYFSSSVDFFLSQRCMLPLIIKDPTIIATNPATRKTKNLPISRIEAM